MHFVLGCTVICEINVFPVCFSYHRHIYLLANDHQPCAFHLGQVVRMVVGNMEAGHLYCRLIPLVLLLVDGKLSLLNANETMLHILVLVRIQVLFLISSFILIRKQPY